MLFEKECKALIRELKSYTPNLDVKAIENAFIVMRESFEKKGYSGQTENCFSNRHRTGHNIETARILTGLKMGPNAITAALLHDILDSGKVTVKDIEERFGNEVAGLIENRKHFRTGIYSRDSTQPERNKKLFLALTKDLRSVLIELADRLSNLERFERLAKHQGWTEERKSQLLDETREIHIPLAHKLGVYSIKAKLEDLVFMYSQPKDYKELKGKMVKKRLARKKNIARAKTLLRKKLAEAGIQAEIEGRAKHVYSVYSKMKRKNRSFEEIYDLIAIRAITNSEKECYEVLGVIHALWRPLAGEFDDYIAKPKPNMYQSLHTSVIGPDKKPLEIQIRTREMHNTAEYGVAAHWSYKGGARESGYDKKLNWIKQILEWQRGSKERPFENSLKVDFFENTVFVFTPKGEVIELPEGATALDFAYAVHSEVGNKCVKAKVNGKIVSLDHLLANSDSVEIMTSQKQTPRRHWLSFVVTEKAKAKIRQKLQMTGLKRARGKGKKIKGPHVKTTDKRIRLAKCCSPLPGDDVKGFLTTKRKVSVHRQDCPEGKKIEDSLKEVAIEWESAKGKKDYFVGIEVTAIERPGLLSDLLRVLSDPGVKMQSTNARAGSGNLSECSFKMKTSNVADLKKVMVRLEGVKGVKKVERAGV